MKYENSHHIPILDGNVNHIFLARRTPKGLEYLVNYEETQLFSVWIHVSILLNIPNFLNQLQKFNEEEKNINTSSIPTLNLISLSLDIVSHRVNNNGIKEYLCKLDKNDRTTFFWEKDSEIFPKSLLVKYQNRPFVNSINQQIPRNLKSLFQMK